MISSLDLYGPVRSPILKKQKEMTAMRKTGEPLGWRKKTFAAVSFVFFTAILIVPFWLARFGSVDEASAVARVEEPAMFAGAQFFLKSDDAVSGFRWGSLVAAMNPGLSAMEADEIGRAILRYSGIYGLPPNLIVAIIRVESGGNLFAVSPRGAQGLMQVMPFWKKELGIEGTLFDVDNNIRAGSHILAENISRWGYKEGIVRYYRGNMPVSGERYFVKVQDALKRTG